MNSFQTFFPLGVLLAIALCGGWLIPYSRAQIAAHRRDRLVSTSSVHKDAYADIDAVIANNRQRLAVAMENAKNAMRAAHSAKREIRTANRELESLAEREQQQHRQAS
jgi:hypothetical protein